MLFEMAPAGMAPGQRGLIVAIGQSVVVVEALRSGPVLRRVAEMPLANQSGSITVVFQH